MLASYILHIDIPCDPEEEALLNTASHECWVRQCPYARNGCNVNGHHASNYSMYGSLLARVPRRLGMVFKPSVECGGVPIHGVSDSACPPAILGLVQRLSACMSSASHSPARPRCARRGSGVKSRARGMDGWAGGGKAGTHVLKGATWQGDDATVTVRHPQRGVKPSVPTMDDEPDMFAHWGTRPTHKTAPQRCGPRGCSRHDGGHPVPLHGLAPACRRASPPTMEDQAEAVACQHIPLPPPFPLPTIFDSHHAAAGRCCEGSLRGTPVACGGWVVAHAAAPPRGGGAHGPARGGGRAPAAPSLVLGPARAAPRTALRHM